MKKNIFLNLPSYKHLLKIQDFSEEKNRAFTEIVLTFLALSFFGFFAINPTLSTITQLKKQLADAQFVSNKLSEKITNLSLLGKEYDGLSKELPFVFSAIPQKPTVPLLTGQLRMLAKDSNLSLQKIQVYQVELTGKNSSYVFSLEASGTYEDISKFLSSFVNFERLVTIETFTISKGAKENQSLRLSLRAKAYFMN